MMTNASYGDNTQSLKLTGTWKIWAWSRNGKTLPYRNKKFGNPDKFLSHIDKTKWMSFFLTVEDYPEFFERLEKMTGTRAVRSAESLSWIPVGKCRWSFMIGTISRISGRRTCDVLWGDGLFGERIGSYIKKPMAECTGNEIIEEMLYHLQSTGYEG